MIPAAQAFQEIAAVRYCPDVDILAQVRIMAGSSQCILTEVLTGRSIVWHKAIGAVPRGRICQGCLPHCCLL